MYGRKQGYKRKWASTKKGTKGKWKGLAPKYFSFGKLLFCRTSRRYAKRPRFGAPASTYATLQAYPSGGGAQFGLSTMVRNSGDFVPDRAFVKMRYVTTLSFTSTSGVPAGNVFSGNSVYDPNQTGAGHKAYGFDQLAALYDSYLVTHSSCVAGPIIPGVTTFPGAGGYRAALQASQSNALNLSDIAQWQENSNGYSVDGVFNSIGASAMQGPLHLKRSAAKMFGAAPTVINTAGEYSGNAASDPNSQWYWKFFIQTYDQTTTASFSVKFTFTYYVMWYTRKGSQSSS